MFVLCAALVASTSIGTTLNGNPKPDSALDCAMHQLVSPVSTLLLMFATSAVVACLLTL